MVGATCAVVTSKSLSWKNPPSGAVSRGAPALNQAGGATAGVMVVISREGYLMFLTAP